MVTPVYTAMARNTKKPGGVRKVDLKVNQEHVMSPVRTFCSATSTNRCLNCDSRVNSLVSHLKLVLNWCLMLVWLWFQPVCFPDYVLVCFVIIII